MRPGISLPARLPARLLIGVVALAALVLGGVAWSRGRPDRAATGTRTLATDPVALVRGEAPLPQWTGPTTLDGRSIVVVGDSLLKAATPYLRDDLLAAGATDVTITAMNGSTIDWAAEQLRQRYRDDIVVIASGTNDVVDGWNPADDRHVTNALQTVAPASCPVWIAPTAWRHPIEHGVRRTRLDATSLVALLALLDRIERAPIHVADWGAVAPELRDLYDIDGIHHTAAGSAAYARYITATIVQECTDRWSQPVLPSRR